MMKKWMKLGVVTAAICLVGSSAWAGVVKARVTDADWNGRMLLEVSFPTTHADPEIAVKVNGRTVFTESVGGGSGSGRMSRSLAVNPAAFGRLRIEVAVAADGRTRRARTSANYRPQGALLPDWCDSELILGSRGLSVKFRHARLLDVAVNGRTVDFGILKIVPEDGITYTAVIAPGLVSGENHVTITALSWTGETVIQNSTVVFSGDGEIRSGQVFRVVYGHSGSRSGPFYRTTVDSQKLVELASEELADGRLLKTYRAQSSGPASITIEKRANFLGQYELERTIALRITR